MKGQIVFLFFWYKRTNSVKKVYFHFYYSFHGKDKTLFSKGIERKKKKQDLVVTEKSTDDALAFLPSPSDSK